MIDKLWILILIWLIVICVLLYFNLNRAYAHDEYTYTIAESIPNFGKALKVKEKKYKQILLQAKREWGETVDAPFLARKEYEMNVAIYNNIIKEMKLLGIYDYHKESKEDKAKKSYNRRYR